MWLMKQATVSTLDSRQRLMDEHRELDQQLRTLTRRAYLTPDEQRRATELKRLKLSTKDRLQALARLPQD